MLDKRFVFIVAIGFLVYMYNNDTYESPSLSCSSNPGLKVQKKRKVFMYHDDTNDMKVLCSSLGEIMKKRYKSVHLVRRLGENELVYSYYDRFDTEITKSRALDASTTVGEMVNFIDGGVLV